MNKISIVIILGLILIFLASCASNNSDAVRFKEENEMFNGLISRDGENYHKSIYIPSRNPFVFVDGYQVYDMLSSTNRSGIIYMGFPECPWCRALLPSLIDAVQASRYRGNVYHYNGLADRDILRLNDDGEIEVVEEGEPIYHRLVELLYDYLGPYLGLYDDSIRRIYFPTTVFFSNGEITSVHLGTVEGQTSGFDGLNEEQHEELKNLLIEQIREIQ